MHTTRNSKGQFVAANYRYSVRNSKGRFTTRSRKSARKSNVRRDRMGRFTSR
jgi:hypothetical protein